jgi:hypothetical protein
MEVGDTVMIQGITGKCASLAATSWQLSSSTTFCAHLKPAARLSAEKQRFLFGLNWHGKSLTELLA